MTKAVSLVVLLALPAAAGMMSSADFERFSVLTAAGPDEPPPGSAPGVEPVSLFPHATSAARTEAARTRPT